MRLSRFAPCSHVEHVVEVGGSRVYIDHYGKVLAAKRAVMLNGVPEPVTPTTRPRPSLLKRLIPRLDAVFG